MVTFWYTADLHFGHRNISRYCNRPWNSVEEMDEGLVSRWNSVVKPEDNVYVLGDVALSASKIGPVRRLNGVKHLVAGNHDSCWCGHKNYSRQIPRYLDAGFATVNPRGYVMSHLLHGSIPVTLSHLPYREYTTPNGQHLPDREGKFDPYRPDSTKPLLCGHVHTDWRVNGNQINVGVDVNNWYPVHHDQLYLELVEMLNKGQGEQSAGGVSLP